MISPNVKFAIFVLLFALGIVSMIVYVLRINAAATQPPRLTVQIVSPAQSKNDLVKHQSDMWIDKQTGNVWLKNKWLGVWLNTPDFNFSQAINLKPPYMPVQFVVLNPQLDKQIAQFLTQQLQIDDTLIQTIGFLWSLEQSGNLSSTISSELNILLQTFKDAVANFKQLMLVIQPNDTRHKQLNVFANERLDEFRIIRLVDKGEKNEQNQAIYTELQSRLRIPTPTRILSENLLVLTLVATMFVVGIVGILVMDFGRRRRRSIQ